MSSAIIHSQAESTRQLTQNVLKEFGDTRRGEGRGSVQEEVDRLKYGKRMNNNWPSSQNVSLSVSQKVELTRVRNDKKTRGSQSSISATSLQIKRKIGRAEHSAELQTKNLQIDKAGSQYSALIQGKEVKLDDDSGSITIEHDRLNQNTKESVEQFQQRQNLQQQSPAEVFITASFNNNYPRNEPLRQGQITKLMSNHQHNIHQQSIPRRNSTESVRPATVNYSQNIVGINQQRNSQAASERSNNLASSRKYQAHPASAITPMIKDQQGHSPNIKIAESQVIINSNRQQTKTQQQNSEIKYSAITMHRQSSPTINDVRITIEDNMSSTESINGQHRKDAIAMRQNEQQQFAHVFSIKPRGGATAQIIPPVFNIANCKETNNKMITGRKQMKKRNRRHHMSRSRELNQYKLNSQYVQVMQQHSLESASSHAPGSVLPQLDQMSQKNMQGINEFMETSYSKNPKQNNNDFNMKRSQECVAAPQVGTQSEMKDFIQEFRDFQNLWASSSLKLNDPAAHKQISPLKVGSEQQNQALKASPNKKMSPEFPTQKGNSMKYIPRTEYTQANQVVSAQKQRKSAKNRQKQIINRNDPEFQKRITSSSRMYNQINQLRKSFEKRRPEPEFYDTSHTFGSKNSIKQRNNKNSATNDQRFQIRAPTADSYKRRHVNYRNQKSNQLGHQQNSHIQLKKLAKNGLVTEEHAGKSLVIASSYNNKNTIAMTHSEQPEMSEEASCEWQQPLLKDQGYNSSRDQPSHEKSPGKNSVPAMYVSQLVNSNQTAACQDQIFGQISSLSLCLSRIPHQMNPQECEEQAKRRISYSNQPSSYQAKSPLDKHQQNQNDQDQHYQNYVNINSITSESQKNYGQGQDSSCQKNPSAAKNQQNSMNAANLEALQKKVAAQHSSNTKWVSRTDKNDNIQMRIQKSSTLSSAQNGNPNKFSFDMPETSYQVAQRNLQIYEDQIHQQFQDQTRSTELFKKSEKICRNQPQIAAITSSEQQYQRSTSQNTNSTQSKQKQSVGAATSGGMFRKQKYHPNLNSAELVYQQKQDSSTTKHLNPQIIVPKTKNISTIPEPILNKVSSTKNGNGIATPTNRHQKTQFRQQNKRKDSTNNHDKKPNMRQTFPQTHGSGFGINQQQIAKSPSYISLHTSKYPSAMGTKHNDMNNMGKSQNNSASFMSQSAHQNPDDGPRNQSTALTLGHFLKNQQKGPLGVGHFGKVWLVRYNDGKEKDPHLMIYNECAYDDNFGSSTNKNDEVLQQHANILKSKHSIQTLNLGSFKSLGNHYDTSQNQSILPLTAPLGQYALKMIELGELKKQKQIEHLFNERDILCLLQDQREQQLAASCFPKLYATFKSQKHINFLMEPIDGLTLNEYQKEQVCIKLEDVKYFAAKTLVLLEYLHNQRIIYRDLKTENIIIDAATGDLKLVDFGFAKDLSQTSRQAEHDRTFTKCGTPGFTAPEVLLQEETSNTFNIRVDAGGSKNNSPVKINYQRGRSIVKGGIGSRPISKSNAIGHIGPVGYSYPVDVWSWGVLVCELIGGFNPFQGATIQETMDNISNMQVKWPRNLDTTSGQMLQAIFQRDPGLRPTLSSLKRSSFFSGVNWNHLESSFEQIRYQTRETVQNIKSRQIKAHISRSSAEIQKQQPVWVNLRDEESHKAHDASKRSSPHKNFNRRNQPTEIQLKAIHDALSDF